MVHQGVTRVNWLLLKLKDQIAVIQFFSSDFDGSMVHG